MRIIIAGKGINVYFLAKRFISKGYQVSVISSTKEDCDYYARNLRALVIYAETTDPEFLTQAEAHTAEIFIGMTDRDQDNLVLCQMAQEYFQIPNILAVVNDPDNEEVFQKMGVRAMSNSRFLIESIESMSAIDDIKRQFSAIDGRIMLTELEISSDSRVCEKKLLELSLPGGVLVAAILRSNEVVIPQGNTVIMAGDRILIISLPDNQAVALRTFS